MRTCSHCGFTISLQSYEDESRLRFCPQCAKPLDSDNSAMHAQGALETRVLALLKDKQYIEAVKLVREEQGRGLKECKDLVDRIARDNGLQPELRAGSAKSRFWVFLVISAFLGLMIGSAGIAVFPQLGLVASPLLCDGQLIIRSSELHTLDGQGENVNGVSRSFQCPDGTDRTFMVFLVAAVEYTLLILALLYLRRLFQIIRGS